MKKVSTIFIIIVLSLGLLGFFTIKKIGTQISENRNDNILWMQESVGIQVPINSSFLEFYEGMEYGKLLKYKLNQNSRELFINNYGLSKVSSEKASTILITDIEKN